MAKGQKSKKHSRSNRSIWSITGLEKRCQDLIMADALKRESGLDEIVNTINSEFADKLAAANKQMSRHALKSRLNELVWTKKVEGDLWSAINNKMLHKFREMYSYIPEKMVTKKAKALKGLTHAKSAVAKFKAGMGVLDDDELAPDAGSFEFPDISYHNPLIVSTASEGQLPIINGALIGIPFTDIANNTLRRALADARKRDAAGVVLTNLFWLYNKKTAGFLAVYRAMCSGLKINPDRFPADYQQEVRDIVAGKITDKLVYQIANEQFNEVLDGLDKVTHRPNDKGPEFPGKVYVVLGIIDEEFIMAAAYAKCRHMTLNAQNDIQAELNMANHRLEQAKKRNNVGQMRYWSAEVARLGRKKARTIITNIAPEHYEFYRRRYRALVVKKIEATIPNSTVIAQGSTWLKIDDGIKPDGHIIKIHIPRHDQITDGLLADAGDNYGKDVQHDKLADLTVECHPYSPNHRRVGREDSKAVEGTVVRKPITKFLLVAGNCLDVPFLRELLKSTVKAVHPVHRLINESQLEASVPLLKWDNGILSVDPLPIAKLDRFPETNFAYPYPRTRYYNLYLDTDHHWGGVPKRFIWDREHQVNLGVNEAAIEMMRRCDLINPDIPAIITAEMDDPTDGNLWFNPTYRPDPQDMAIVRIQKFLQHMAGEIKAAAQQGDNTKVDELTNELNRVVQGQLDFKGEHFPHKQLMQVFDRHLEPNMDFFSAVLSHFVAAKMTITGLSQINDSISDDRDIGVHNTGGGNHGKSTVNGAILEGPLIAGRLADKLGQEPKWRNYEKKHPGFLASVIRSPHFGGETFGGGIIQAPGHAPWAIRLLGSPPRLSSWSDLLRQMASNDLARGDDTYGLMKYFTLVIMGDKHFYCTLDTERVKYVICAAGVHTDTYGSTGGFPPNNTGVMFTCLPADGPDSGPVIHRMLPHDFLRDWFAKPTGFDWNKFLPPSV